MKPVMIPAKELQLGDVIRTTVEPWNNAIVKYVDEDSVTLFRPYGTHADFSYTGGVICYIGIDEYRVDRDDFKYLLLQRTTLK